MVLSRLLEGLEAQVDAAVSATAAEVIGHVLDATLLTGPGGTALGAGVAAAVAWLGAAITGKDLSGSLRRALEGALSDGYCHHGPYVAQLDFIGADGQRVQKYMRCAQSDVDA